MIITGSELKFVIILCLLMGFNRRVYIRRSVILENTDNGEIER